MPYVRVWISDDEKQLLAEDAADFSAWCNRLQHKPRGKGIAGNARQRTLPLAMSARNLLADGLKNYYRYGSPVTRTRWQLLANSPE